MPHSLVGYTHPILLEFRWSHSSPVSVFSFLLFQFLSRRSHRRYLLTGEGLKGLCYEMRVRPNHLLPATGLHHVCHVTCIYELNRLKIVNPVVTQEVLRRVL